VCAARHRNDRTNGTVDFAVCHRVINSRPTYLIIIYLRGCLLFRRQCTSVPAAQTHWFRPKVVGRCILEINRAGRQHKHYRVCKDSLADVYHSFGKMNEQSELLVPSDVVLESGNVLESDSSPYFEDSDLDLDSNAEDSDSNPMTRSWTQSSGF